MPTSIPARTTEPDDAALAERIVGGDRGAFDALMRRYNRQLFRTARSVVGDDAEAEDVLQDAYLLAYRGLAHFRGEASLSTWLTRIVLNAALGRKRTTSRRAEIIALAGAGDYTANEGCADPLTHEEEPEMAAIRAETRRLLERKIDALPETYRTVFVLREVEEMSVEQVADALGIPDATVRSRHFRGKAMLRESLSRELDFALLEAFAFDGARCDRIVAGVLGQLSSPQP